MARQGRADARQLFRDAELRGLFSDGTFVYIPEGVRCPMELSTYFRINAENTGQFERTLIVADKGSLCQLSRRLHRADARRKPAARRGGRTGRAR
jgi:Fe-S cluster assembly scaffold protein SufB